MKTFELTPINRKSFYGKCKVVDYGEVIRLFSYDTEVAKYDKVNKTFWNTKNESHLTNTTLRHIKAFQNYLGLPLQNKKELLNA